MKNSEMGRRDFLAGGGFIGLIGVIAAAIRRAAAPASAVETCRNGFHEPREDYMKHPALSIGQNGTDPFRSLVPCRHCNVLFALTIPKNGAKMVTLNQVTLTDFRSW